MFRRLKTWGTLALSIMGVVTFALFILEEAIQMTTFGTWPAQHSKDWNLVLEGADTIENINKTLKIVNYTVGWIQPLAFLTYRSFGEATDYYVKALRRKIFAYSPESFIGQTVEFVFTPKRIETDEGGRVRLVNGRITVLTDTPPPTRKLRVIGTVGKNQDRLIIKADLIEAVQK